MEKQDYPLQIVLYQDNQSATKMEKSGRNSCNLNSRHIKARYFFGKDLVNKGEIRIEYCPTKQMLADYFTKPLQEELLEDSVGKSWDGTIWIY